MHDDGRTLLRGLKKAKCRTLSETEVTHDTSSPKCQHFEFCRPPRKITAGNCCLHLSISFAMVIPLHLLGFSFIAYASTELCLYCNLYAKHLGYRICSTCRQCAEREIFHDGISLYSLVE